MTPSFTVKNPDGSKPDLKKIALTEEWASSLMWMDMDCFAIDEHGCLMLLDDCGGVVCPPEGRFIVEWKDASNG